MWRFRLPHLSPPFVQWGKIAAKLRLRIEITLTRSVTRIIGATSQAASRASFISKSSIGSVMIGDRCTKVFAVERPITMMMKMRVRNGCSMAVQSGRLISQISASCLPQDAVVLPNASSKRDSSSNTVLSLCL